MAFSFLRILTYVLGLVGTALLLPLGVYTAAAWCAGYIRTGSRVLHGAPKAAAWATAGVLIAFGIARNFFGW